MSDLTVPVTIIPWEEIALGTRLGEGGFGIVYKGTCTYAYGITAWELVTRKIPYQDVGDTSIIKDAVKTGERAEIPANCPQTFASLIQACWDQVPSKRPNMDMVVKAMEQLIAQEFPAPAPAASVPQYQDASFATLDMVTQLPKPITPIPAPATCKKYIAEYDYVSTVENGLSFKKGDIINISSETGEWWLGELNGKTGWVPYNHVKLYVIPTLATASQLEPAPTFLQMQALQQEIKTLREQVAREQAEKKREYQEMERLRQECKKMTFKPQVNPAELQTFLNHVVAGRQNEAESMLITQNSALALVSGTITDHAQRTFLNITGFQYAVWALDWHMWRMIKKYLPPEEACQQAEGFATGPWVKDHGEHVNWQKLIENYQIYIDKFSKYEFSRWTLDLPGKFWVQQIGGEQRLLPMHVLQEYCQPNRPFDPVPNFRDDIELVRNITRGVELDAVGKDYALERGKRRIDQHGWRYIDDDPRSPIFLLSFSRVKEIQDRRAVVQLY